MCFSFFFFLFFSFFEQQKSSPAKCLKRIWFGRWNQHVKIYPEDSANGCNRFSEIWMIHMGGDLLHRLDHFHWLTIFAFSFQICRDPEAANNFFRVPPCHTPLLNWPFVDRGWRGSGCS
jgi:hypothetical protein